MRFRRALARNGIRNSGNVWLVTTLAVGASLIAPFTAKAQSQSNPQSQAQSPVLSDLARQNLERVAASAAQVAAVLRVNPGLMVEVKRWVAKDATDHGQLVSDSDLTDQAIYDRLEDDVRFRSVVTAILQKYGYLLPQVNPNSPEGKQQELLIQERTKWLAQEQEEELTQERQQFQRNDGIQQVQSCPATSGTSELAQGNQDCATSQPVNTPRQPLQPGFRQPQPFAPQPDVPSQNAPVKSLPTLDQAQLVQPGNPAWVATGLDASAIQSQLSGRGISGLTQPGQSASLGALGPGFPNPRARTGVGNISSSGFQGPELNPASSGIQNRGAIPNQSSYPQFATNENPMAPGASSSELNTAYTPSQTMLRRSNPFEDIPSLYDMYLQAMPQPPQPQRFGMQIFENGTRDLQMIPMDLPVGPEYVLGPGDSVAIDLWGGVSQQLYRTVDTTGRVALPEVGPVLVAGKTLADAQQTVQKTLRSQFRDVSADVSLARLRNIRVYVVGDVAHPGAYDISSLSTPLNALFYAGGPTARGSLRLLEHYRGKQLVQDVDVYDLLLHGVKTDIQRLDNGDTVLVPPVGSEVTIEGMVRRPAIYELKDEKSLADVIQLAGGLLPTATLRHIEVQRIVAHEKHTMLSLDVLAGDDAAAVSKQLESFQVQNGDRIRIFPIAPYNQDTVYLEGHVLRPGRYSFQAGMRVTDLISSYKDLLPEPATQYAEIIRLEPPDFRPTVESFNLAEALAHPATAPVLDSLDTVQIFGRYDFENPPTVSVWGDVRQPGTYRTSGQIHLSDAIHMAGGLSADAEKQDAQVFRYLPNGELKIFSVKLGEALAGEPSDNIVLESRDRILVHRSAAAVDPATVYIKGEVARPGRYPLTTNMTIADLIRAAGGLQQSADLKDADLTYYGWNGKSQLTGQHGEINLASAMAGNSDANTRLHNGDVLTVRQLPGWNDLGASITIRGEVKHPGTYGIRPGERLSSVLERAGGFVGDAYPYGSTLERRSVRDLEDKSQEELVMRVKGMQTALKTTPATDPDEKLAQQSAYQQWQSTIEKLTNNPPLGRVTIQISSNIRAWRNTPRDIAIRAGDVLVIPKRPSYVMVQGEVYNATAVSYQPGRSAKWYLSQAGGPTNLANKRAIFVIRADGTVIGGHGGWFLGGALSESLHPGDTVVVPEKAIGGPPAWKAIFQMAQVASAITTSAILAAHY